MGVPVCSRGSARRRAEVFNGWEDGARQTASFDVVAATEAFAVGSDVMKAMDHTTSAN
jgi:hypothetical protein